MWSYDEYVENPVKYGNELKETRGNYSIQTFSEHCRVAGSTLWKVERAKTTVKEATFKKINEMVTRLHEEK